MNEEEVLKEVVAGLDNMRVPYALTGGIAASFYGKPRSTHDFDIIIQVAPEPGSAKKISSVFEKDFYASEEGIIDALLHKTMFNIIHHETGLKIDLWVLKEDEYDRTAFARREKIRALGMDLYILSAEDMILNKLLWHKISDIDKHLSDARSIGEFQKERIDKEYLAKWALKLSIGDLLDRVMG